MMIINESPFFFFFYLLTYLPIVGSLLVFLVEKRF